MGNAQTDKQPDRLAQTCSTRHATYLLDGVEGAHPLGPTVRQPAGDLAAAHQPLAAPEVAVLAQHPAGPSKCHRHSEEDRQTDRQAGRRGGAAVRTFSTSSSLTPGLLCLGFRSREGVERQAGRELWDLQGRGGSWRAPRAGVQALRASDPSQPALPPSPSRRGGECSRSGGKTWRPPPPSLAAPAAPRHTHTPPLIRMDSTWLLKPSACRLRSSPPSLISFPSKHSRPYRKMDGSEKCCGRGHGEGVRPREPPTQPL